MPFYDRKCLACDWTAIDVFEAVHEPASACPSCGELTERAWLTTVSTVIGDEIDHTQVNGTRDPIRFRSRSELRRWRKEHGYVVVDSHVGKPGSDKSPFTSDWNRGGYDPYTAANVKELLERAFQAPQITEERDTFHVDWYDADGQPSGRREAVTK